MMKDKTSTAKQFSLTPAVIEARRSALQELSFVELSKISENQKGEDPQEVIGRVSRADKKKMIETIGVGISFRCTTVVLKRIRLENMSEIDFLLLVLFLLGD